MKKTAEEKAALKAAKASHKQSVQNEISLQEKIKKEQEERRIYRLANPCITTGLMPEETELPLNYPVYWNYLYVGEFSDGTFKVIRSDIKGTINDLLRDQRLLSRYFVKMYRCNLAARNLL